MTDYGIAYLEFQRQYAWEPVCHPGMDDCVDTWVSHVYCTSPLVLTTVVSSDKKDIEE